MFQPLMQPTAVKLNPSPPAGHFSKRSFTPFHPNLHLYVYVTGRHGDPVFRSDPNPFIEEKNRIQIPS